MAKRLKLDQEAFDELENGLNVSRQPLPIPSTRKIKSPNNNENLKRESTMKIHLNLTRTLNATNQLSASEIAENFQEAVQMCKKVDKELFKEIQLSANVDLCFVVDATSSMQPHIDATKKSINEIVDQLLKQNQGIVKKMRLALVAYRDFEDDTPFECLAFTESVSEFREFCSKIIAKGGGDMAEDVLGGLYKAAELKWGDKETGTKLIFHICDAPCHGKIYHDKKVSDKYAFTENGNTHTIIFNRFRRLGIQYHFGRINARTDLMLKKFSEVSDQPIQTFEVKDISRLSRSVVSAVHSSMLRSSMRAMSTRLT